MSSLIKKIFERKNYFLIILSFFFLIIFQSCNKIYDNFYNNKQATKNIKITETINISLNNYPKSLNPFLKGDISEEIIKNLIYDSIIYIDPINLKLYKNYLKNIYFDIENKIAELYFENDSINLNNIIRTINILIKNINSEDFLKYSFLKNIKLEISDKKSLKIYFNKNLNNFDIDEILINFLTLPLIPESIIIEIENNSENFFKSFKIEYLKNKNLYGPYIIENFNENSISLKFNKEFKNPKFIKGFKEFENLTNINFIVYDSFEKELLDFINNDIDIIYFNEEKIIEKLSNFKASFGLVKNINPYNNLYIIKNANSSINIFSLLKNELNSKYNNLNIYKNTLPYNNSKKLKTNIFDKKNFENNFLSKNNEEIYILVPKNIYDKKIVNIIENKLKDLNMKYKIFYEDTINLIAKIYGNLKWDILLISLNFSIWNLPDLNFFNPYSNGHIINLTNIKKIEEVNIFNYATEFWNIFNYINVNKNNIYEDNNKIKSLLKKIDNEILNSNLIYPIYFKPIYFAYNKKLVNFNPIIYNNLIDFSFPKMIYLRKKR
jgi:hypothetical protein